MSVAQRLKGKCIIVGKEGIIDTLEKSIISKATLNSSSLPVLQRYPKSDIQNITKLRNKLAKISRNNAYTDQISYHKSLDDKPKTNNGAVQKAHHRNVSLIPVQQKLSSKKLIKNLIQPYEKPNANRNKSAFQLKSHYSSKKDIPIEYSEKRNYTPYTLQDYMRIKPTLYYELGFLGPNIRTEDWNRQNAKRNEMLSKGNRFSHENQKAMNNSYQATAKPSQASKRQLRNAYSRKLTKLLKANEVLPNYNEQVMQNITMLDIESNKLKRRIETLLKKPCG